MAALHSLVPRGDKIMADRPLPEATRAVDHVSRVAVVTVRVDGSWRHHEGRPLSGARSCSRHFPSERLDGTVLIRLTPIVIQRGATIAAIVCLGLLFVVLEELQTANSAFHTASSAAFNRLEQAV